MGFFFYQMWPQRLAGTGVACFQAVETAEKELLWLTGQFFIRWADQITGTFSWRAGRTGEGRAGIAAEVGAHILQARCCSELGLFVIHVSLLLVMRFIYVTQ